MSSSPLITIKASSSVSEAADMMLQYNVRHLLIIDNADKPLGIITPLDFTRYQKHVADEDKEAIQKALQTYMASEASVSSSSSVHFEDGLESS
jgi:signal-transduction protein with cAMP-binding, CBS, and nucleotidyltransferase domain